MTPTRPTPSSAARSRSPRTTGETGTQQTKTVTTYYRGAGETLTAPIGGVGPVTDLERFAGEVFTSTQLNGEAAKVSETVTTFGTRSRSRPARSNAAFTATRIPSQTVDAVTYDASGTSTVHHTKTTTTFNALSQPDQGRRPRRHQHRVRQPVHHDHVRARDRSRLSQASTSWPCLPWLRPSRRRATSSRPRPADVVSASEAQLRHVRAADQDRDHRPAGRRRIHPDLRPSSTTPAAGSPRPPTPPGRPRPPGTPTRRVGWSRRPRTTNPLGHVTTTRFDPILGVPVASTDANGRTTTGVYDALGRLIVGHLPAAHDRAVPVRGVRVHRPTERAERGRHQDDLRRRETPARQRGLYDALMRPFQTQQEGRGTGDQTTGQGRMVTHTFYDSAGRMVKQLEPWWVEGGVSATPQTWPGGHVRAHHVRVRRGGPADRADLLDSHRLRPRATSSGAPPPATTAPPPCRSRRWAALRPRPRSTRAATPPN